MKKWLKITIGVSSVIVFLIVFVVLLSYYFMKQTLPDYNGEIKVRGINSQVKIYRDKYAIPYIEAKDKLDAYFALGYIHAQERLFQMDISRRAGEGRLSEIIGPKTLPFDKMFRTIGLLRNVKENYSKLHKETKDILKAYSAGVNAYINNPDKHFPIEFSVLGYDPEPWQPIHSLLMTKLMAFEMNISWWTDISFTHLIQKLGVEKVKDIMPSYDENSPTIIPPETKSFASIPLDLINVDRDFRKFMGFEGTHIGSNNWVVNGKLTESGKPIIANDPHLAFQAPGKWVVVSMKSKNLNVQGFTLPGIPGVVIGKNKNISWVLTNVMTDDCDFYAEKLDSLKQNYFFKNKWKPISIINDTIKVKDSSDVVITIRSTHRGPIVSDIHPYKVLFPNKQQNSAILSMRWTALEPSDELYSFYLINTSKDWKEFKNGVKYFTVPGQNFVYADNKDNIGYICGTRLPIRLLNAPSLVYDGTTDKYDWKGFVPYKKMPKLFNPKQNFIASANNKTVKNFKYQISNIWEPSSRIERITELLKSKPKFSVEDFKKFQMDFYSFYAKNITKYILGAFNQVKSENPNVNTALDLLRNWDYIMDKYSQVPTIYTMFLQKLIYNIYEDEMGKNLLMEYIFIANVPYRNIPELLKGNNSVWFDNINTKKIENRDDIIRKSLEDAVRELENRLGKDITYWQWRKVHKVIFKHLFHGVSSMVDRLVDIGPFDIGGDGTTIFNTEYSFTKPFENKLGPSMRYIYDFAKPDEFNFILTTGQSGNIISDHYKDMTQMWLNGGYIKQNVEMPDSLKNVFDFLKLLPK
ncbi:acyl-homoserine lactone acylase QuiP precursor [bacterium BMS3Abin04]|nr:acyl-homoserine lactone acylase QuiP precursor [bacterium BMS3Abin04]